MEGVEDLTSLGCLGLAAVVCRNLDGDGLFWVAGHTWAVVLLSW